MHKHSYANSYRDLVQAVVVEVEEDEAGCELQVVDPLDEVVLETAENGAGD